MSKDVTTALNHIIDVAGQAATIMNGSINSKKREFLKTILSNGVLTDTSACFYLKKTFDKLLFAKGCKMWLRGLNMGRTREVLDLLSLGKNISELMLRLSSEHMST